MNMMLTFTLKSRFVIFGDGATGSSPSKYCTLFDTTFASLQDKNLYGKPIVHRFTIMKRPGVDDFLREMAKYYEIIVYTASVQIYADPILNQLDTNHVICSRLYRESCVQCGGGNGESTYRIKDLSLLGRDLSQTIFVDDFPTSYLFQPDNAIDITYIPDYKKEDYSSDRDLEKIATFLKGIKDVPDVRGILKNWRDWSNNTCATEAKTQE
jgi:Dullard-like phosphatase family protein